jgi:hypothetical protein
VERPPTTAGHFLLIDEPAENCGNLSNSESIFGEIRDGSLQLLASANFIEPSLHLAAQAGNVHPEEGFAICRKPFQTLVELAFAADQIPIRQND